MAIEVPTNLHGVPTFSEIVNAAFEAEGLSQLKEGDVITPEQWTRILTQVKKELDFIPDGVEISPNSNETKTV